MVKDTITFLSQIQQEKFQLLTVEEYNLSTIQTEHQKSDRLLKEIQSEESRIKDQLNKQKRESERLNTIITDLIKKEEAAASAKLGANKVGLSGAFANNKKNLSWPVAKGVITEKFGIRQHPTLKNVKTENLGIDMLCPQDTKVTSIYDGTVLIVTYQPPYDNIAIINHGDYTTAYYYLNETYVEKGRKVSAGEVIGSLKNVEGGTDFHFEIWYKQKQVDPELWLQKR
jgi:murein DD-endopeptidase MepM/ murein hydrolase activator NlpD